MLEYFSLKSLLILGLQYQSLISFIKTMSLTLPYLTIRPTPIELESDI